MNNAVDQDGLSDNRSATPSNSNRPGSTRNELKTSLFLNQFKPSISDKLKVGYHSMDRCCQTERTDIVNVKEMTGLLVQLMEDVWHLKNTMKNARLTMQADYENKVEKKSIELYTRMNERISKIEELYNERIQVIRRSFRTQLADAISKLAVEYQKYYGDQGNNAMQNNEAKLRKIRQQQAEQNKSQQEQAELIALLMQQAEEAEALAAQKPPTPSPQPPSTPASFYIQQIDELKDILANLDMKVEGLQERIDEQEIENQSLEKSNRKISKKLEKELNSNNLLEKEIGELKQLIQIERQNGLRKLQEQKENMENELSSTVEKLRQEEKHAAGLKREELEKEQAAKLKLQKEKQEKEMDNLRQQKETVEVPIVITDGETEQLKKNYERQLKLNDKLRKQYELSNKAWEAKLIVVQQTLHALKDEMFTRTTLYKQAAKLQHTELCYVKRSSGDQPLGFMPSPPHLPEARKYQLPSLVQAPNEDRLYKTNTISK